MTKYSLLPIAAMTLVGAVAVPVASGASDSNRGVKVRILSPRSGAELPAGTDKVTIVVEVEDSTESGIKTKKGIPVFDTPTREGGSVDQASKDNLGVFLKNLVGVTTYTLPARPGRPVTTIYQLTSVIRTALLSGGCQHPIYPPNLELPKSGESTIFPTAYAKGAAFQFSINGSASPEDETLPRICIVPPPGTLN